MDEPKLEAPTNENGPGTCAPILGYGRPDPPRRWSVSEVIASRWAPALLVVVFGVIGLGVHRFRHSSPLAELCILPIFIGGVWYLLVRIITSDAPDWIKSLQVFSAITSLLAMCTFYDSYSLFTSWVDGYGLKSLFKTFWSPSLLTIGLAIFCGTRILEKLAKRSV